MVSVDRLKSHRSASSSTAIWDAVADGGFCSVESAFRVYNVSVQSSELGLPHPLTRRRLLLPPPLGPTEETHLLAGEGVGGPNSDDLPETQVLCTSIFTLRCI
jgi:hypothetical protein